MKLGHNPCMKESAATMTSIHWTTLVSFLIFGLIGILSVALHLPFWVAAGAIVMFLACSALLPSVLDAIEQRNRKTESRSQGPED